LRYHAHQALCLDAFSRTASILTPIEAAEKLFKKALASRRHDSHGEDDRTTTQEADTGGEEEVDILFALDLSMSCMRAFLQGCDQRDELEQGLRQLKDLQARFYTASTAELRQLRIELERIYGELVQLITSDAEHQRKMKLRVKRWRRRDKDLKEDLHVQAWGSHLTHKLTTLPPAPPGGDLTGATQVRCANDSASVHLLPPSPTRAGYRQMLTCMGW
jgi:hypothetical protein